MHSSDSHGVQLALLPPPPYFSALLASSASVAPSLGYMPASVMPAHVAPTVCMCAASSVQPPLRLHLCARRRCCLHTQCSIGKAVVSHAIVFSCIRMVLQLALLPPSPCLAGSAAAVSTPLSGACTQSTLHTVPGSHRTPSPVPVEFVHTFTYGTFGPSVPLPKVSPGCLYLGKIP